MKLSLAGIQPAYVRIIKRRYTGSGPAYALEYIKLHYRFVKAQRTSIFLLTTDNHIGFPLSRE
jgi:hypothetical protein